MKNLPKLYKIKYINYAVKNEKKLAAEAKEIDSGEVFVWATSPKHATDKIKAKCGPNVMVCGSSPGHLKEIGK